MHSDIFTNHTQYARVMQPSLAGLGLATDSLVHEMALVALVNLVR